MAKVSPLGDLFTDMTSNWIKECFCLTKRKELVYHSELVYPPTFDILIMEVLTSIFWSGGKSLEMGFPVTAE